MSDRQESCPQALLSPLSPHRVLDVGCGDGSFTRTLAALLRSAHEILGIDPEKDSIDEARTLTGDPRVRYRVLADHELIRASGRYNLVSISNTLHHLTQPVLSIRRVQTFLAPGGLLLVREMVSDGLTEAEVNSREIHHVKAEVDRACGRVHDPTYTREQIMRIVHEGAAGWKILASCEEHSTPVPDTGALDYVRGYLSHLSDQRLIELSGRRLDEVGAAIARVGIAQPPRLLVLLAAPDKSIS